jgi:hypothetical protein
MTYGENLPYKVDYWLDQYFYLGQKVSIKSYAENGKAIAELNIEGYVNHFEKFEDESLQPSELNDWISDYANHLLEVKYGKYQDNQVA